ncbi:hypothetical protein C0J52_26045 [Blattella germanica]|nr:hypothetical protein C0J52_26045 [Blattella germanica]
MLFCEVWRSLQVWMTWSQEKYQAVFNSFSDNIVGKSLQRKLCQTVPVDVVYTWVNGSDPVLLQQLQEQWLSDEMVVDMLSGIGVKDMNVSLAQRVRMGQSNWTLVELSSPRDAGLIAKTALLPNVTASLAHWTSVNVSRAHLLMELPLIGNSKDFSPSRFEDKEELRYSLRSLERYAPWVRHVYLVTNGQIPYWLDLENPRLTIITHEMIFPERSHLPTFSSPAIESHLHRIPGLSKQFLYLNDDVMFGKEVWPDDFITNANGQKVYLSWPVPDCSDSCPWSWVADGSCDVSCNTSECSFDGGDCDLSAEDDLAAYDENRHLVNYDDDGAPYNDNQRNQIRDHLNDNLFRNMNFGGDIVLEDLPDPGKRMNSLLDILIKKNVKKDEFSNNFTLFEDGNQVNVKSNSLATNGSTIKPEVVQMPGFADEKTIERNPAETNGNTTVVNFNVSVSNTSVIVASPKTVNESTTTDHVTLSYVQKLFGNSSWTEVGTYGEFYPKLERENAKTKNGTLNVVTKKRFKKMLLKQRKLPFSSHYEGETLETKHENQNSSYNVRSNHSQEMEKLLSSHIAKVKNNSYNTKLNKLYQKLNGRSDDLGRRQHSDYDDWRSEERVPLNTKKKQRVFDSQLYNSSPSQGKKPQDTFAESLLYVNRLFNLKFGFEPRKVPAHMPHLIDIDIMEKLQERFSTEWQLTSSHKVRNAQDMQFAFSYFYFLMSNKEDVPLSDIFDTFDTDRSGTWSDREIRTLLTRCFELPLNYARVVKFESDITNCSKDLPEEINISTPPYERYQDSKLVRYFSCGCY